MDVYGFVTIFYLRVWSHAYMYIELYGLRFYKWHLIFLARYTFSYLVILFFFTYIIKSHSQNYASLIKNSLILLISYKWVFNSFWSSLPFSVPRVVTLLARPMIWPRARHKLISKKGGTPVHKELQRSGWMEAREMCRIMRRVMRKRYVSMNCWYRYTY